MEQLTRLDILLDRACQRFPQHTAVVFGETRYTYEQLQRSADRLAASLVRLGLRKNDHVAVLMFNRPEMLLCYYACFKIGVTVIPIIYRLKSCEIRYIVNNSMPRLLITETRLFVEVAKVIEELPSIRRCYLVDWQPGVAEYAQPFAALLRNDGEATVSFPTTVQADTNAAILYTSGTTGRPKGTMLTHGQLAVHTVNHAALVNYQSTDKTLACLALCCNFSFTHQMLPAAYSGAALEIMPCFDADQALAAIRHHGITMLYMMPVMYNELVNLAARQRTSVANVLRLCVVAGDVTPLAVMARFKHYFGLELCEGLGMTETQVFTLNPVNGKKKMGSVGIAVDTMQVAIQDEQGRSLPSREVGEIVVKGEVVTSGYLNDPKATAEAFRDGWFLTGDLGYFDEDGYLWFKGRKKQIIVHGGANISPQEVEEAFYHHPDVWEAAVIGIPDQKWGEIVKAYVALKPHSEAVTETGLLNFVRQRLADYKMPENIEFLSSLPKGNTGKIDRRRLRRQAMDAIRIEQVSAKPGCSKGSLIPNAHE